MAEVPMRWQLSFGVVAVAWGIFIVASWLAELTISWWLLVVLLGSGFTAGLARLALPALPIVFGGSIAIAYLVIIVSFGVWAAGCPDCASNEWRREDAFIFVVFLTGTVMALELMAMGLGTLVASVFQRVRTWRLAGSQPSA